MHVTGTQLQTQEGGGGRAEWLRWVLEHPGNQAHQPCACGLARVHTVQPSQLYQLADGSCS